MKNKVLDLVSQDIMYEDEVIIIVKKPSGIPTQATLDPNRDHLFAAVKRFLLNRDGEESYLALHHRLDSDTSGLVLFCKKKIYNKEVAKLFEKRLIQKFYCAVVKDSKNLLDNFEVKNYLKKYKDGKIQKNKSVKSGGDPAHTEFSVLERTKGKALLVSKPKTGRMHQIRVHLAERGIPILGDKLYGGEDFSRLMLFAFKLEFFHEHLGKKIIVESDVRNEVHRLIE